ncbi:hypothetical protein B0H17DRAFT_1073315 [Mycena rosella]|uniref:BRCT domain-containing protein n=1 Tax=Mycena rosella TaxID=1033263 RepID=A0AAD7D8J2_MYCRO|nr:hypothetical protein B0H17DRAFT_1073315 [Mycena rosella]
MDAYFPVTKSSATTSKNESSSTKRDERKYKPYNLTKNKSDQPSAAAVSKFLLSTLASDDGNPITHSDSGENAIYVFSTSTGHQVSEGKTNRRLYLEDRARKIKVQTNAAAAPDEPQVLVNVRCYINGFLADTTDLEMKRIIVTAGGKVLPTASNATHILTSQHLSGSKTQHILNAKSRSRVPFVVKPEWVTDSIKAGKKRPEREYSVLHAATKNLYDMMAQK